jgi:hypothetical protein
VVSGRPPGRAVYADTVGRARAILDLLIDRLADADWIADQALRPGKGGR